MAKILFAKTVKYQGINYPPYSAFEVSDSEIADLTQAGGWIQAEDPANAGEIDGKTPKDDEIHQDGGENLTDRPEIEVMREEAAKLGIEFKGNWGVKKLSEAIANFKNQ